MVTENASTVLTCETTSEVAIQWYRNDKLLTSVHPYRMLQKGALCQLEIVKVSKSDNATFSCVIMGTSKMTSASLVVQGNLAVN